MCSVMKGVMQDMRVVVLIKTSKRIFKLVSYSYTPSSPFILVLFSLTYQFVNWSKKDNNGFTTLYKWYVSISWRTYFIKFYVADTIHLSIKLSFSPSFSFSFESKINWLFWVYSYLEMFWIKNLYALNHGRKISLTTFLTPCSLN
jgi:hypothetical protein